jgi:hypothetical protein
LTQLERVANEVSQILHFASLVVVGEDNCASLLFEASNFFRQFDIALHRSRDF